MDLLHQAWQAFTRQYDARCHYYRLEFDGEPATVLRGEASQALRPAIEAFVQTQGLKAAVTYREARACHLYGTRATLFREPALHEAVSEVLHGEPLLLWQQEGDACLVQRSYDNYLGWLPHEQLAEGHPNTAGEVLEIRQLRGHLYDAPTVRGRRLAELAAGMRFISLATEGDWHTVRYGGQEAYLHTSTLQANHHSQPSVQCAEKFLHTPYLWGGITAWGLDCSGLVQTVCALQGVALPRDADQQHAYCQSRGRLVTLAESRAGDLAFFPGHVAWCHSAAGIIHANGHHMRVTIDAWASAYGQDLQATLSGIYRLD